MDAIPLYHGPAPLAELAHPDAPNEQPRLTPFPLDGRRRACVIVFPGGGYNTRAPHEGTPIAAWLNRLGVASAVLDYRVKHRHPASLRDAQRAIRLVRERALDWNIDPARVGILGFSAGGHLAANAATCFDGGDPAAADPVERRSCRPDAAVLCYPVISAGPSRHGGSITNLLGPAPWSEEAQARVSCEQLVGPDTPPSFVWHTSDDAAVPLDNALLWASACARQRVPCALHVFPRGRHGLGLAAEDPTVSQWTDLCARWLGELGFL